MRWYFTREQAVPHSTWVFEGKRWNKLKSKCIDPISRHGIRQPSFGFSYQARLSIEARSSWPRAPMRWCIGALKSNSISPYRLATTCTTITCLTNANPGLCEDLIVLYIVPPKIPRVWCSVIQVPTKESLSIWRCSLKKVVREIVWKVRSLPYLFRQSINENHGITYTSCQECGHHPQSHIRQWHGGPATSRINMRALVASI